MVMNFFKYIALLVLLCNVSCILYSTVDSQYLEDKNIEMNQSLSEFDVYVFNICEDTNSKEYENRFIECPEIFYGNVEYKSIKKIEELYLLIEKSSNLVIYFTTFSHKYIYEKSGFLNKQELYENKFYLDDVEYIYLGKYDPIENTISFLQQKTYPSMKWKLSEGFRRDKDFFNIDIINTKTQDTEGSTFDIPISDVFKIPLSFRKSPYNFKKNKNDQKTMVDSLYVLGTDDKKKEILFRLKNSNDSSLVLFNNSRLIFYPDRLK